MKNQTCINQLLTVLLLLCVLFVCMAGTAMAEGDVASVTINGETTYYTSIKDAVAKANESGNATITLLQDTTTKERLDITNSATLDLNGNTLSCATYFADDYETMVAITTNNTKLTIIDSVGGGKLDGTGTDYALMLGEPGAYTARSASAYIDGSTVSGSVKTVSGTSMTVSGSTVESNSVVATIDMTNETTLNVFNSQILNTHSSSTASAIDNSGTLTITDSTVSGSIGVDNRGTANISGNTNITSTVCSVKSWVESQDSTLTITGGSYTGGIDISGGTATISGGSYTGGIVVSGGTATISDGTITESRSNKENAVEVSGSADLTISGGTFSAIAGETYDTGVYVHDGGTVKIIGGTITSTAYGVYNDGGSATITGGSISGGTVDLQVVGSDSILNLTLDEGKTVGATFPGGITAEGITLAELLATDTAAYWGVVDGKDTMLTVADDAATGITDKGDITIRAKCDHKGDKLDYITTETTHTPVCSVCNWTGEATEHTGGTATCQAPAVCEACGVSYGDLDANIHTPTEGTIFTDNGDGTHSNTCACGAAVAEVPHTLDVTTGKCSACGADMTAIATVTDGTNTYYAADAATLNQAVTAILEKGSRTFTVELPADTEAEMIIAIRRAICDTEGVADGSIHLTLKGVTSIPGTTNWDGVAFGPGDIYDEAGEIVDQELVTQLASINLPDVTEIGAQAFYFCENLVSVSAPKAQTIGAQAFGYTALTSVEFPELTTIPTDMFSGTWTLSSAKFPKVTTIEQGGLLVGAKFTPENNPTPFPLELTAEGDITFNGSYHFNIAERNYTGKVDLVLCCDKKDAVTFHDDGTATWQVREDLSYTFKSITFKHSYVDGKCTACGEDCAHTGGTATCTTPAVCESCGASYGEVGGHSPNAAGYTVNADGTHSYTCSSCGNPFTESHTFTDGACTGCGVIGGYCGEEGNEQNVIWTYANGTLTISGTGAIADQRDNYDNRPWEEYVDQITTIVVNDGITSIGEAAFWRFQKLTTAKLPDSLTTISQQAFYGCTALKTVNFPANLKTIEGWAFLGCALESVTLPEGLTTIGYRAFSECKNLTSVTVPASVTTIDEGAFGYSPAKITVAEDNPNYSSDEHGVLFDKDKTTLIYCRPNIEVETYTIPSTVTEICKEAFYGCENLATITIPDGVQKIGSSAFGSCEALTTITIPAGVTTIEANTFYDCTALTAVTIPAGVTTIDMWAFSGCTALTTVTIPASVTSIAYNAFSNCSALTTVNVPCTWDGSLYTFEEGVTVNKVHNWVGGACTVCGVSCDHTDSTHTAVTDKGDGTHSFECSVCGETGSEAHNYKTGTSAGACACGAACPHSNFDPATGNCKDCETSLAIAKIKTGETTTYYQTAYELSTAIENNSADQAITLLANFEVIRDLCFYAFEAKNTLDLNGHTLTGSSRIDVEYGELTITGTGSINTFMTADNEGAKIVVGSGVTLNDTLRSVYGGILDLTNATIPEAGLNVILYTDDWKPATYNVSDVLKLPVDHYFFVNGVAVHSYSETTEGKVLKHTEHSYTYTDNGDGTHKATCTACGKVEVDNEPHTIENHVCTACGAMEIAVSFNAGDFEWKTGDKLYFCRVSGDNEWEEYAFTATVAGDGTVTWTPDRTLYWDGTGEHKLVVIYPDTGYVWDTWYIDEDQSTLENLRKNDHLNSIWSGNPTTNPITFNLKHRLAKVTVNYEIIEDVAATVSNAEIYSLTQYLLFDIDTLERRNVAWEEGHDLWINSYHNGNQFTAFVSPDAYAADGNFIKITLSDGSVREVKMNKAVTFEEGAEYTYTVVITADGAYLVCADGCTNFTYTDNEDGTHDKVCTDCGKVEVDNENHTPNAVGYTVGTDGKHSFTCVCGATVIEDHDHTNGKCVCGVKATPTFTIPANLTATYGDALADVTLPNGFTWQDATTTTVGNAGSNTFKVTYTPDDTDNYETVTDIEVAIAVAQADIANAAAAEIPVQVYDNGNAITPEPVLTFKNETLVKDTDYTLSYSDNTAEGTAAITITGMGNFTGTKTVTFEIVTHEHVWMYTASGDTITASCEGEIGECPVENSTVTIQLNAPENLTYDGTAKTVTVTQTPEVVFNDIPAVEYEGDCQNCGTHTAKLTYNGVAAALTFTIGQKSIDGASIGAFAGMTYNGAAQTPNATVTIDGLTVTGSWSPVTNVGEKSTFTANDNFTGTLEADPNMSPKTITITGATIEDVLYQEDGQYTLNVTGVTFDDAALTLNTDYTASAVLTGENKVANDVGATVTVNLTNGNFTLSTDAFAGSVNIIEHTHVWSYTVNGDSIIATCSGTIGECPDNEQSVTLNAPGAVYSGNPVNAEVTRDGAELTFTLHYTGTDYASADAPTNAGDYIVTMTVGNKSIEKKFTISPKNITNCSVSLTQSSFVYSGKAPELAVTAVDNGVGSYPMVEGIDYTVGTAAVNVGNHKLTVAGTGNYTGSVELDYSITAQNVTPMITGLEISYTYTGVAIQPDVIVKVGETVLVKDTDYSVSYGENLTVANGGSVTATLKGNFSGETTVSFAITKAPLTVTADSKTMTTGQERPALTYTITGFVNGETENVLITKPTISCEADGQTAGTYDITVSNAAADNYDFSYVKGTLSVIDHEHAWTYTAGGDTITATCGNADTCTNATQTIKLIAPASLVYDGSEKAVTVEGTIDGTSIEVIYSGDRRNVTADGFSASVTLGSAKAEISGMKITPAPVTITGLAAMDRTYDGTVNVMLTGGALNGVVSNDDVTIELTGASIVMADKNVGTNKPVSISGITLGGTAAGNYELLEQPSGVTVNITAAPLTIKSATIADVLYREDGNYTLMVTGVEFDGLVNGENLTLDTDYTATAQLTGANTADTAVDATVTVRLSNSNYSLGPNTCSAKVNLFTHKHGWSFSVNGDTLNAKCSNVDGSCPVPQAMATIQLVAPSAENLVYNGQPKTVTVAQTPDSTFSDLPVVSYCCTGGCINAGEHTAKLTYRGVTAEKKFTIAQKDITGANFGTFAEMTYNGAAQTPSATVTIDGLTVTGAWSGVTNVSDKTTFTASGNFAGTIADQTTGMKKAAPTAADFTFAPPANPVYDGSEKAASVTTDKSGMGVISIIYYRNGGDAPVTPADAGEYLVAINVTEGENYLAASSLRAESWKFSITQTQTTMTAKTDDMTYVYGEVITVTGTADVPQPEQQGFNLLRAFTGPKAQQVALYDASGNQLTDGVDVVNGAYTITYDTKLKGIDPGQELTLTVQFVGDANMSNRSVATNKFTLNAKSISPVVSGTVTKAYDGTTAVPANHNLTISLTDKIDGDTVNASGSFAYADAIVGTGKAINTTGIILSGTDAKFYMLSTDSASSAVGEITKAKLNGVTAPADQTLNVYCMNATAAIAQLPTTVTYSVEGGGTIALNISWSCDSYNNTPNAENTFTWSVNDAEKLACYAPNTGVATSGSINVKNSAAIPVTLTGTPVTITYSGTTYDVSAMFTIGQGAGTPSYEIVTGGTGEGTLNGSALTITKAGTFTVKLTTAANGAYAASTATAVLTVEKGIPTVTAPTGLAAYYSQTLSQITLPADANGTWSWADGNTLVGEVGQRVHKAIFTPKDTNLWHAIYVDVTINVVQAGTVFVGDVGVYNGETATKAFTYGDTITVKVKPAAAQPATFSLRSLLAPQKDQMALYIRANGTDTQITNPVTADKSGIFTMEYVTTGKALVIGNNKLVAKYVGNDNMAAQEQEIEVTLAQKELSFVSITAQSRAYEQGNNQVFVTGAELNGVESGDSVTLDTAGLTASVSSDAVNTYYSAMLPAGISLTGNDAEYYFITGSVSVTVAQGGVEITEKQPAALTFELSQTSFVYNRNEQKPTVTIKDGESILTAGMDYDITWPENCIDVGEKAILITFKGNYSGEVTLTYEIVAQIPTIIVKQPTDQFVVEGQRAEFSIEATGAGLTYQWYINRNDGRGWRDIEGAIGAVYITSVTDLECDGFQYGCLITDQYGNTLKSDVAVLHVSKVPVLPETGDSSTPMLWLAMSILSMAGILLLRKKAYSR